MPASKKRKTITILLLVLVLVALTSGGLVFSKWNKPLGPGLGLPTLTVTSTPPGVVQAVTNPQSTQGVPSNPGAAGTQAAPPDPAAPPMPSPTATKTPLCNGPASMTILAIGSDQRGEGYLYGLADSIHIVHVDFTTPKIMVIDFPRDLWVEIPEISDHHGITHGKLNQAYLFGNPGMGYYDGPGEGPGLMARTLDLNFGLRVDHYVAIDTQTFVKLVDAVGGIDIQVDAPIDLSYGYANPGPDLFLSIGTHHLDGEHALILSRNRIPSTFQRMKYQKIVLGALREKLLSPAMLPKIPKLVAQFITSVQSDLSLREINSLLCIAQAVTEENIQADSFPQEMFTASSIYDPYRNVNTFIYEADFLKIRAMVADFMKGIWPFP